MKMKYLLFVPECKKNLFSISALYAKGMRVAFVYGQLLMWPKGKTIDDAVVIGEREGGLYKLKGHPEQTLVMHFGIEGLHMCITKHYLLQAKLLKVFQNAKQNMMVSAKDVRKERIQRSHFPAVKAKPKTY